MSNDFQVIHQAVTGGTPARIPLYEHFVDDEIIQEIMGYDYAAAAPQFAGKITTFRADIVADEEMELQRALWNNRLNFYMQMGYDYLPVEFPPIFKQTPKVATADTAQYNRGQREWINEHEGVIRSIDDLENPEFWPPLDESFDYNLFANIAELLPEGVKIIGGFAGGPMEHALYLLGFDQLFIALHDDEVLLERLFEKLRAIFVSIATRLAEFDALGIMRIGDDLGFKTSTLISPAALRKYIFPIYRDLVDVSHRADRPFILHSCGNLEQVMDDIIDDCRFDAKHSFEDAIMPFVDAKQRWGGRIAMLGGLDVDFLCRRSESEIKEETKRVMEACSRNGFAFGSGNTIPNYMPVKNYLAMVDAVREFNG